MAPSPPPHDHQPPWPDLPQAAVACVLSQLGCAADRKALRMTCRAWQHSADGCWRRAAYVCSYLPEPREAGTVAAGDREGGDAAAEEETAAAAAGALARQLAARPPKPRATDRFLRGAFLFPVLRTLDLLELRASFKLAELARLLTPQRLPLLASLGISCPLGEGWGDGGALGEVPLAPQLRSLRLYGLTAAGGLPAMASGFRGLTELVLSAQLDADTADVPSVEAVSALMALTSLQALELPALGQEARQQLSLLTGLTRLSFEAAGEGAVGESLLPLAPALRRLRIGLHLRKEHFIVLHPQIRYDLLALLTRLQTLEISNLAAYTWAHEPDVWSDEPPPAEHALRLLQALPELRSLELRAAFCRIPGEACDAEEGALPPALLPDGRSYACTLQRVPVRRPGFRRPAEWFDAWWQAGVQAAMARCLGEDCSSLTLLHEHVTEQSGWMLLDRHRSKTYDVLGCWQLRH